MKVPTAIARAYETLVENGEDIIHPNDLPRSASKHKVRGKGMFRGWTSRWTWAVVDLRRGRFVKVWGQKARDSPDGTYVNPRFRGEDLVLLMSIALRKATRRVREDRPPCVAEDAEFEEVPGGAHDQALCEMCTELGRACNRRLVRV